MNNDGSTIKTCPKCDATFTCSPVDCWCSSLPPVMPLIPDAGCYCPACLKVMIDMKLAADAHTKTDNL